MANWADEKIANQLGFVYCVLFPRGRDAIKAWTEITKLPLHLPTNVCSVARDWAACWKLHPIDSTGMAPGITTQLYGYRNEGDGKSALDLDPLGTGFFARPCAASTIISFGEKKFISVGGAAFCTNDQALAEEMQARSSGFPPAYQKSLEIILDPQNAGLAILRDRLYRKKNLWDRHLGDSLERINREQIIPWRVIRLAFDLVQRNRIVIALRDNGYDVGTNYPPLPGAESGQDWGRRVLNFFCDEDYDEARIKSACEIIKRAIA